MPGPMIIKCYIPNDVEYPDEYIPSRVLFSDYMWSEFVQRDIETPQGIKRVVFRVSNTQGGRAIDYTIAYCIKLERIQELTRSYELVEEVNDVDPIQPV